MFTPSPASLVSRLVDLLTLEQLEDNVFRGRSQDIGTKRVFGGQVVGQALSASQATLHCADERRVHSLHAYFLRAGDTEVPIIYQVDRTRDGGSFSVRRVTAIQHGQVIFFCAVSFQDNEHGAEHQPQMPEVPAPEDLPEHPPIPPEVVASLPPKAQHRLNQPTPYQFRLVHPRNELAPQPMAPQQAVWFRLAAPVSEAPTLHRALLAYASDFKLLGTSTYPHAISYYQPGVQMASLDHAIWFHRPFRADQWLLYAMDSPTAQSGRGLARGQVFDRAGCLVASVMQEGLIRTRSQAGQTL